MLRLSGLDGQAKRAAPPPTTQGADWLPGTAFQAGLASEEQR